MSIQVDTKNLAKQALITSQKKSLDFYFTKLVPEKNKLRKVKIKIEEICEELRYHRYPQNSKPYQRLNSLFQEEHSKETELKNSIEKLQQDYLKLKNENKEHLETYPDLYLEVAKEVARLCKNEKARVWERDIEKQREKLYSSNPTDMYEYEMMGDELKCLDQEERELDDHLEDYYNTCVDILMDD